MWCITNITDEYRKRMYRILNLYAKPYDKRFPVVCFDEKSKQILADSRKPIPMKPGSPEKYDYEYVRNGTCNRFTAVEPKAGKHHIQVTDHRKREDFAKFIKWLILTRYKSAEKVNLHFPNCLSADDKEQIIVNYLNFQDTNINYVRLITKSRDNNLRLSPHTRLKAKKLSEELNNKILEEGHSWNVGTEVSLSNDQDEPYKETWENNIQKISYSIKWLDKQKDDLSLFHNFSLLFDYTDIFGTITLVSKESELDVMEKVFMRSKNEYLTGTTFTRKSNLSHIQIFLYSHYLNQINKSVESILYSFVNNYLIDTYNPINK